MLILQDVSFLQLLLWISAALLMLALVRIFTLSGQNRRMRKDNAKMENWAIAQQAELTAIHHDAQSWRARTQRQFDALRSELSARLEQSERSNQYASEQVNAAREKALADAHARVAELETQLAAAESGRFTSPPSTPAIPALPAMETLRLESLASELQMVRDEAETRRQQNAALQRSLLMARRKQPARRNGSRVPRHG